MVEMPAELKKEPTGIYKVAFESLNEGVLILSSNGMIVYANCAMGKLLKNPVERLVGTPISGHTTDESTVTIESIIEQGSGRCECNFLTADKGTTPALVSITSLPIEPSPTLAMVAVITDLSETKERNQELQAANERLTAQIELTGEAETRLRALSNRVLEMQEEERRNIARELHDEVGQNLTVLKLMIGRVDRIANEEVKPLLKDISATVSETIRQVREISMSLRPNALDQLGLIVAMEGLFKQLHDQADLQVHFDQHNIGDLPADLSMSAYRITQEALTNIMRHAGVKEAWVGISRGDDRLLISIEDHGRGVDLNALGAKRSTGLSAMKERATLLGGKLDIQSSPGKGMIINVALPVPN